MILNQILWYWWKEEFCIACWFLKDFCRESCLYKLNSRLHRRMLVVIEQNSGWAGYIWPVFLFKRNDLAIELSFWKDEKSYKRTLQAHLGLAYPGRGSGTTRSDFCEDDDLLGAIDSLDLLSLGLRRSRQRVSRLPHASGCIQLSLIARHCWESSRSLTARLGARFTQVSG